MSAWRPSSPPQAAERRAAMLDRARQYFATNGLLAVDTPSLSQFAGSDPNIESLSVTPASGDALYLHTSPEFCMKRLLAAGYPDIYSICRVFRDSESGRRHLPEFTMIEWYRLGFGLKEIIDDTAQLIAACLDNRGLAERIIIYDYDKAFALLAGVDVFRASPEELADCASADGALRQSMGDDRDAWLDLILATIVAPKFAKDRLTVIRHYPASMAALARHCPADDRVADRFEVFMGERELANGYVELTDAREQRRRFENEIAVRRGRNRPTAPVDELLLDALAAGLPACAGVALGAERLQMVLDQTDNIGDVVTFVPGDCDD